MGKVQTVLASNGVYSIVRTDRLDAGERWEIKTVCNKETVDSFRVEHDHHDGQDLYTAFRVESVFWYMDACDLNDLANAVLAVRSRTLRKQGIGVIKLDNPLVDTIRAGRRKEIFTAKRHSNEYLLNLQA